MAWTGWLKLFNLFSLKNLDGNSSIAPDTSAMAKENRNSTADLLLPSIHYANYFFRNQPIPRVLTFSFSPEIDAALKTCIRIIDQPSPDQKWGIFSSHLSIALFPILN